MKIKAIIFDWDGVLCYSSTRLAAEKIAFKLERSVDEVFKVLDDGDMSYLTGKDDDAYFVEMSRKLGVSKDEILFLLDQVKLLDTFEFSKLLSKKYDLFILSNQINERTRIIRKYVDLSHFKKSFFSNEISLAKPSLECFSYVVEQSGFAAGECLFVDDRERNVEAAKEVGLQTCLFSKLDDLLKVL